MQRLLLLNNLVIFLEKYNQFDEALMINDEII